MARYWVGGSGTWDASDTTHWSASSGGAGGASVPTSSDDAIFDANSGTTTCTLSGVIQCANFDASATSLLIFTGTTNTFSVYGNFTLKSGMTWSHSGTIKLAATTTGKTGFFGFSSTAGNTRVLTLGSSTINCNYLVFNEIYRATLTFNYNTSTIDVVTPATTANVGGMTFYNLKLRIGGTNFGSDVAISGNPTITNDLTITGYDTQYRLLVRSDVLGTQRTITANNIVSLTNTDFRDIIGAGAATWTGTSIGDHGGNSGITTTTPVTRYWVGQGGSWADNTWATTSGGAAGASMPIAQDTAIFDANSFNAAGQTITVNVVGVAGILDFTNVTNNPAITFNVGGVTPMEIYGSLTLKSGMTWTTQTSTLAFGSRSPITITTAGVTVNQSLQIRTFGTTVTLGDDLTIANGETLTLSNGTLDANNKNVTTGLFSSSNSNTRTLTMGSGLWTLVGVGTVWSTATTTNLTFNKDTANIKITDTSTSAITFSGGGQTFNNLWFSREIGRA